mmetsp:Transcript_69003/g.109591  ORF Transcript_69003/g.109591 Transcript_69003/m.109591 type:complete len:278 (-) Transcript_69003:145-978(-)
MARQINDQSVLFIRLKVQIPQFHRRVLGRRRNHSRIRTPAHLIHRLYMTQQAHYKLTRQAIPNPHRFIKRSRRNQLSIRTERHMIHNLDMSGHPAHRLLGHRRIPQKQRKIIRRRHQQLTAYILGFLIPLFGELDLFRSVLRRQLAVLIKRTKSENILCAQTDMVDPMRVALQHPQTRKIVGIPHADSSITRRRIYIAFATPLHRSHHIGMAAERKHTLSGARVPYFDQLVFRRRTESFAFPFVQMERLPTYRGDELGVSVQWIARDLVTSVCVPQK